MQYITICLPLPLVSFLSSPNMHAYPLNQLITALELAVHHGWGGQNSAEKANMLMEDVITLFTGPQRIYKDVSKV